MFVLGAIFFIWLAVRPWKTTNANNINKKLNELNRRY
jgi:hypothetical protein